MQARADVMPLRTCKCGTKAYDEEDLNLFVKKPQNKYGRQNKCKKCHNAHNKIINYHATRYGVSKEYYNECMKDASACEVCGTTDTLCYDHDHNTLLFRGILCRECNRALGLLRDSEDIVYNLYKYIKGKNADKK